MPPSLISQVKKTKTIIEKNKNKNYVDLSKYDFIASNITAINPIYGIK